VFLHGASGPVDAALWLAPLNVRLAQLRHSRSDGDHDWITSPAYLRELLLGRPGSEPARTWTKGGAGYQRSRLRYLQRQEELCRVGRNLERFGTAPEPSWLPGDLVDDT